jgi:hypothetical protein
VHRRATSIVRHFEAAPGTDAAVTLGAGTAISGIGRTLAIAATKDTSAANGVDGNGWYVGALGGAASAFH